MFQIVLCNAVDVIISIFDYRLKDRNPNGNPNVNDVKTNLNNILLNQVVVSYDKSKINLYIKNYASDIKLLQMYLKNIKYLSLLLI